MPYGRSQFAALALDPQFPSLIASLGGASEAVPFENVRVLLRRADGTIALDSLVAFPAEEDSISLTFTVPIPIDAPAEGLPLTLTMAYVNAQGDTVFRGGPETVIAAPLGTPGASTPITIPITFDGVGKDAVSVVITPDTTDVVAGTTTNFSAVARDAALDIIPGTPIFFYTLDSTRASVPDAAVGSVTWLPSRGVARIVAAHPNGQPSDTAYVTVALPASKLVVGSGNGQTGTASVALAQPLVVRTLASDDVPVAGVEVSFAVATGGGSLSVLVDTSDASGNVETSWTLGATVGPQTITATAAGLTGSPLTLNATATAGVPAKVVILSQPSGAVAGVAMTPPFVVAVQDSAGNTVTSFTGNVGIELPAGSNATLDGTAVRAAVAGLATFDDLSITRADSYLLIVTSDALDADTSSAVTISAASASRLTITQQPSEATAGAAMVPAVTVVAVDAFGNVAVDFTDNVTLTLCGCTAGAVLSGTPIVAAVSGEATFSNLRVNKAATGYSLAASAGALLPDTTNNFDVVAAPAALMLKDAGDAQTGLAGTTLADSIVVLVVDSLNNPKAGVTVNFAAQQGGSVSPASVVTDSDGLARAAWTLGATPGAQTVNVTSGALAGIAFDAVAEVGAAVQLAILVPSPVSLTAGVATSDILISGTDSLGNIDTTFTGTVIISIVSSPPGGFVADGELIVDAVAGVATFTGLMFERAGTYVLRFAAAGLTTIDHEGLIVGNAGPQAVNFAGGDLQAGIVGTTLLDSIAVVVTDNFGNPIADHPVTWSVLTGGGSVSPASTTTDEQGRAATAWTLGFALGEQVAEANTGSTGSVQFSATATAGAAANIAMASPSGDAQAGDINTTLALPLRVVVTDSLGNPVQGTLVNWNVVSGDASATLAAVLTDSLGISETEIVLHDSVSTITIHATVAGLNGSPVVFTATINQFAVRLEVVSEPVISIAGTPMPAFAVSARDSEGAIDPNFTGIITASVETGPALGTLGGTINVAAVGGVATFDSVVVQIAGVYSIRFTAGGLTDTVSTNFTVVAGAPFNIALHDGHAQTDTVDAVLPQLLQVKVTDEFGNTVTGAPVAWALTLGSGFLGADTTLSDIDGFAVMQLTFGDVPGPVTVTATADGLAGSPVNFSASVTPGNATHLALAAASDTVDGGVPNSTFVVEARDRHDNVVTGFAGDVTVTPTDAPDGAFAGGTITQPSIAGVATFNDLVFGSLGSWIITFETDGLPTVNAGVEVVVGEVSTYEKVSGDAQVAMATQPLDSAIVVRVLDAGSNPLVGDTVFFAITSGGGTLGNGFAADTALVDANGFASATWILGAALGGQTVEAVTNGTLTLVFDATALEMIANRIWTGDVNTSFTEPGNWKNNLIPSVADSVLVPAGRPNYPALAASHFVSRFTLEDGATLSVGDSVLFVTGSVSVPNALAISGGSNGAVSTMGTGTISGAFTRLAVQGGEYLATGPISTTGELVIATNGILDVATAPVLVGGDLMTMTNGRLEMNDGADVEVLGSLNFTGGSTAGYLTGGTLTVHGDVNVVGDPQAYNAALEHTLRLAGPATQSVFFANPDTTLSATCAQSCLGSLVENKAGGTGGVVFLSGAKALGGFQLTAIDSVTAVGGRLISALTSDFTGTPTVLSVFASQTTFTRGASFTADTLVNWSPNGSLPAGETIPTIVAGEVTLDVDFAPPLIVEGLMNVGNARYVLGSTLETRGNGRIALGNFEDTLVVTGTATFRGKDREAGLSVGVLELGSGLVIDGAPGDSNFVAHAGLVMRFTSPTAFAQIANPAENPLGSLRIAEGAQLEFSNSSAMIRGDVRFEGTTGLVNGGDGGSILILGDLVDTIGGMWSHNSTFMGGSGATLNARSIDGSLTVNGNVALGGAIGDSIVVNGDFVVSGATGMMTMGGAKLIAQSFATESGGRVAMTASTDTIESLGDVRFAGGASTLTAGYLELRGNFMQDADPDAFVAEPAHSTWFRGANPQTVYFAHPGFVGNGSAFGELYHAKTPGSQLTLLTDVFASGMLETGISVGYQIVGSGQLLTTRGADVNLLSFDNVRWELLDGAAIEKLDTVTFSSMDPTVVQWRISRMSGTHLVRRPIFTSAPTSGGKYLEVVDVNGGGDLEITLEEVLPSQHGGGLSVVNGAIVNGWDQALLTWLGDVSSDWTDPANWVEGIIPAATDSVWIPSGVDFVPTIPHGAVVASLRSDARLVTLGGFFTATRRLVVPSDSGLVCPSSNTIFLAGSSADTATVAGHLVNACNVNISGGVVRPEGTVRMHGNLALSGGVLDIGADTVEVLAGGGPPGTLNVSGTGQLLMNDNAGLLKVTSSATFSSTAAHELTAGTLHLGRSFTHTTGASFLATGTHVTVLADTLGGPKQFGDVTGVGFNHVTVTGNAQFSTQLNVFGNLTVTSTGIVGAPPTDTLYVAGDIAVANGGSVFVRWLNAAGALNLEPGAGFVADSLLTLSGASQQLPTSHSYLNVRITGTTRVSGGAGIVYVFGALTVDGGQLHLGAPDSTSSVQVNGNFTTQNGGTLRMEDPATTLAVYGDALFDGGSTQNLIMAGRLDLYGNFTQGPNGSDESFRAFSPHETWLRKQVGNAQVTFANPGWPSGSQFATLRLALSDSSAVELHSDVTTMNQLVTTSALPNVIIGMGAPRTLTTLGANVERVTFNNTRWWLQTGVIDTVDNVTFTAMDPDVNQFEVSMFGDTVRVNDLTFETMPASGKYLRVQELGATPPVHLIATNVSPAFHSGFVDLVNGATLGGWLEFPSFIWTGLTDSDWTDPTNWSFGLAPGATDSVFIPSAAPNFPILGSPATVRALVSEAVDGGLTLNAELAVTERIIVPADSGVACTGGATVRFTGAATKAFAGFFDCDVIIAEGVTIAVGDTRVASLTLDSTGVFDPWEALVVVNGSLTSIGAGTLQMSQGDLQVKGMTNLGGGASTGLLTGGLLRAEGGLTVSSAGALDAAATHTTIVGGCGLCDGIDLTLPSEHNTKFGLLQFVAGSYDITGGFLADSVQLAPFAQVAILPHSDDSRMAVLGRTFAPASASLTSPNLYLGGEFDFSGSFAVDTLVLTGTGQLLPAANDSTGLAFPYSHLRITGTAATDIADSDTLTVGNVLEVRGTGSLTFVGGSIDTTHIQIVGALVTSESGTIEMQDAKTHVRAGAAYFAGGSTNGKLTAGLLRVQGAFSATDGGSGTQSAFRAVADHLTQLTYASAATDTALLSIQHDSSTFARLEILGGSRNVTDSLKVGGLLTLATGAELFGGPVSALDGLVTATGTRIKNRRFDLRDAFTSNGGQFAPDTADFRGMNDATEQAIPSANADTTFPYKLLRVYGSARLFMGGGSHYEISEGLHVLDGGQLAIGDTAITAEGGVSVNTSAVPTADLIVNGATSKLVMDKPSEIHFRHVRFLDGTTGTSDVFDGEIWVHGDFEAADGAFQAGGIVAEEIRHRVILTGGSGSITFDNPLTSNFFDLAINAGTDKTLQSDVRVNGRLSRETAGGGDATLRASVESSAPPKFLQVNGGVNMSGGGNRLNLRNVATILTGDSDGGQTSGVSIDFDDVTFTAMEPTSTYLRLTDVDGYASSLGITLDSIVFETPVTGAGKYFQVDSALVGPQAEVDFNSSVPSIGCMLLLCTGPTFEPSIPELNIWNGTTAAWGVASNWSLGQVPDATTDVQIPVTLNDPIIAGPVLPIRGLEVQTGATLTISGFELLSAYGDVTLDGSVLGSTGGLELRPISGLTLDAAGGVAGSLYIHSPAGAFNGTVTLTDSAVVGGTLQISGDSGRLTMNGHAVHVGGDFYTVNNGTLEMANALDTLHLAQLASFSGGSTEGLLTNGAIKITGNLSAPAGPVTTRFAASGSHTVAFVGSGTSDVTFGNPDPTTGSRIANVAFQKTAGGTVEMTGSNIDIANITAWTSELLVGGSGVLVRVSGTSAPTTGSGALNIGLTSTFELQSQSCTSGNSIIYALGLGAIDNLFSFDGSKFCFRIFP